MSRLLQHLLEKVKAEAIPVLAVKVVTTSSSSNEVARSRGDELGDLHLAIAAAAAVFDIFEH